MSNGKSACTQDLPTHYRGVDPKPTLRQRILSQQTNPQQSQHSLIVEVLEDPLFEKKFRCALSVELKSAYRDPHWRDEVTQDALRSIFVYLRNKGFTEYSDLGEEQFGGWLFSLCRRHIRWAAAQQNRKRQMPVDESDRLAETCSSPHMVHELHYEQAMQLVVQTIRSFDQPLQGVLWDVWNKLPLEVSARKRGISKNYVAILRGKGRALIHRVLSDQLLPILN